jgi:hypothetical protein
LVINSNLILPQPQATALPALGRDESAPHFEAAGASGAFWGKRLFNQSLNGFSCILPAFSGHRSYLSMLRTSKFRLRRPEQT